MAGRARAPGRQVHQDPHPAGLERRPQAALVHRGDATLPSTRPAARPVADLPLAGFRGRRGRFRPVLHGREPGGDGLRPVDRRVQRAGRHGFPLERPTRLGELRPQVFHDTIGLQTGRANVLVPFAPGLATLLRRGPQRVGGPGLRCERAVERLARLTLGRLDRGERRLERALRLGQARSGVVDDRLREVPAARRSRTPGCRRAGRS